MRRSERTTPTGEGAIEGGSVPEEQSLTGEGAIEGRGRCEDVAVEDTTPAIVLLV